MLLRALAVLVPSLLVLARDAHACTPDPCQNAIAAVDLAPVHTTIPSDGVLVLHADTLGDLDPAALGERTDLVVTRDDLEIAGTLTTTPFADLLVWRPAAPLAPGSHDVAGSFTNPNAAGGSCGQPSEPFAFTFDVAAEPTAPLAEFPVGVDEAYFDEPELTLATVVCCDDAYPTDQLFCGVSYGVTWSKGQCAATATRGHLRVRLIGQPAVDPTSAAQWIRILRQDGETVAGGPATIFTREIEAPTCFTVDQRSLATGETIAGAEHCVGDDYADRLGVRPLDPLAQFEPACHTDLYTCDIAGDAWSPTACKTYGDVAPPPDPVPQPTEDPGCGCTTPSTPPLALLPLLLVLRRRR